MRQLIVASIFTLGLTGAAQAATCYVANSCSGQPSPCDTSLQDTLDDGNCSYIELVGGSTFTGDFLIDRSVFIDGNGTATIEPNSGENYTLRVESTTFVAVFAATIEGTVAVYDSYNIVFDDLIIDAPLIGFQVKDSDDIDLLNSSVTAALRAVDVRDSTDISFDNVDLDGGDYGLVLSDGSADLDASTIEGYDNAFVVQNGSISGSPSLVVTYSTLIVGGSGSDVWHWDRALTSFTNSGTVSMTASSSQYLVSLIGYTPWGGG